MSSLVTTKFLLSLMMRKSVIMIMVLNEYAREERIHAQARLNEQVMNLIEDNSGEGPQIINCNFEIIDGNKRVGPHNPGKLIIGNKHKYLFSKVHGNLLHYHCSKKKHLKCTARAKVRIIDGVGNNLEYVLAEYEGVHNLRSQEGPIMA